MNDALPEFVKEEIVYSGRMFEVVLMTFKIGDKEVVYEKARRAPGTRLIITSPEGKILLIEEYRSEIRDWDIRLPGGKVCDSLEEYHVFLACGAEMVEKAKNAAKKEALEEVGIIADDAELFSLSTCGASVIWDLYYFVITKYAEDPEGQHLELGENIKIKWVSVAEAKKLALDGSVKEDRSAATLLRFLETLPGN